MIRKSNAAGFRLTIDTVRNYAERFAQAELFYLIGLTTSRSFQSGERPQN